ncbi:Hydroxyacylglutathione hydrolase GloC [bacterium HR21]|nr:Hydroxyacylglutathione hydrolase GloC [bacterium HR21]
MFLRQLWDEALAQASYFIGCPATREALVIDPTRDVDRYRALAQQFGYRIVAVTETHIHADFLSGSRELAEQTGATLYLSGCGDAEWSYRWAPDGAVLLHTGDSFRVGNVLVTVFHTPGHTPEHLCFAVIDRGRGATQPMGLFTGDFLFVGDVGRPDLLESAVGEQGKARSAAQQLFESLQLLEHFPDFVLVWPGHGAGSACGKALGAVPHSTVGYERRYNPALQISDRERFIAYVLSGQPEPPLYFARMKRLNRDGVPPLKKLPRPRAMTLDVVRQMPEVWLVDTRPWEFFRQGHLDGALFAPFARALPTVVASYVPEDAPIVLVARHRWLEDIVRWLARVGVDKLLGYVEPEELERSGRLRSVEVIGTEDIDTLRRRHDVLFLDVRDRSEYEAGHLPGAYHAPYARLPQYLGQLPREAELVVYCQSGERSAYAAAYLQRAGFRVRLYGGGFAEWVRYGGEVVRSEPFGGA